VEEELPKFVLSFSGVSNRISEEAHRVDHLLEPEGVQIGEELVDSGKASLSTDGEDSLWFSLQDGLLNFEKLSDDMY
jgi:hypothetical protein